MSPARTQSDVVELPHPRDTFALFGHAEAERALLDEYRGGRIAHAWLIGGPAGIGKATLAYRMARFALAHPDPMTAAVQNATSLEVAPDSRVARRVAGRAHPDLLVLEREPDDKGKMRTVITVDQVRRTIGFFGSTAGEGGWRVCIVDAADELNPAGANALLKILEEPPLKSLLLVVSHAPGRLLPTIRSRCRRLALQPLSGDAVMQLLADYAPDTTKEERASLTGLAEGSIGRALELASAGSLGLYREMVEVLATLPELDMPRLHSFAERFAKRGEDANADWRSLNFLFDSWLKGLARHAAVGGEGVPIVPAERGMQDRLLAGASLDRWMEAWEKVAHLLSRADAVNLDRKQTVLGSFLALQSAMR